MPRISATDLATPKLEQKVRLEPPDEMSNSAKAIFNDIVRSCPPSHFLPADRYLLRRFVENALLIRKAHRNLAVDGILADNGRTSPWLSICERLDRSLMSLASKLRICPQARQRIEKTKSEVPKDLQQKPWETET